MKAVILAGGEGIRLLPLTCFHPKPMVPLVNKPVLEYSIKLLKKHGINIIYFIVYHYKKEIMKYFGNGHKWGCQIHYIEEKVPSGTAGCLSLVSSKINEPFLVLSGDVITNFNLGEAIDTLKESDGIATVLVKKHNQPLNYGLIVGDERGYVKKIIEKPSWKEVISDYVNSGIYIFKPEIFVHIEKNQKMDISKNLLPRLLEYKEKINYKVMEGYWSDIGTSSTYLQSQWDLLDGNLQDLFTTCESQGQGGVFIGKNVDIKKNVRLCPPVFIGDNVQIEQGCEVGPYCVIGDDSRLMEATQIERSVIWKSVYVGKGSKITGATIGKGVQIGCQSSIYEGVVVADNVKIENNIIVMQNILIWPNQIIKTDTILNQNQRWTTSNQTVYFKSRGIHGLENIDFTSEVLAKIARAFSIAINDKQQVILGSDHYPFSIIAKEIISSSLQVHGLHTISIKEKMSTPIFRFICRKENADYGIFVQKDLETNETIIEFYNHLSQPLTMVKQKKIEQAYQYELNKKNNNWGIGTNRPTSYTVKKYFESLPIIQPGHILKRIGIINHSSIDIAHLKNYTSAKILSPSKIDNVKNANHLSLQWIFEIDSFGENLSIYSNGKEFSTNQYQSLLLYLAIQGNEKLVVNLTNSNVGTEKQKKFPLAKSTRHDELIILPSSFTLQYDAFYFLCKILENEHILQELLDQEDGGDKEIVKIEIECEWFERGRVIRKIIDEEKEAELFILDGIKLSFSDNRWVVILPHDEKPMISILCKGTSKEDAEMQANYYSNKIKQLQKK
ncbi:sugar phosphate nucleotidyltransferase [Bacillus carboniphilus]|uniref:Sugar phosphate nucleotidyltransferase n=1 Tax=Bacillus carboniphilus TaxID=86663 RepID=A0ABY9JX56_9BACI|nr:sugar phosphate nucleotidyltransferase [Bacillus carboniphilus]WLR43945.1 sugar phosphate nucleotidyltransferase [Bacillus carboniphilus]